MTASSSPPCWTWAERLLGLFFWDVINSIIYAFSGRKSLFESFEDASTTGDRYFSNGFTAKPRCATATTITALPDRLRNIAMIIVYILPQTVFHLLQLFQGR